MNYLQNKERSTIKEGKEVEKNIERNREKKQYKKEDKGITLVALVITVVVLLILAGITIFYVMGDNGIFQKAKDAKEQTEVAIRKEQEDLEIYN